MRKINKNKFLFIVFVFLILIAGYFFSFLSKQEISFIKKEKDVPKVEYVCPMHPQYSFETSGVCSLCGMNLLPRNKEIMDRVYISPSQAMEINLTTAKVSSEKIERWIRIAGLKDINTKKLKGMLPLKSKGLVTIGQQVRAFPLIGREPVLQGKITNIISNKNKIIIETNIIDQWYQNADFYVMEIIVNLGKYLAIPNEVIIEEEERKVVYVKSQKDYYMPRDITTGLRGELYTQVLTGLEFGEELVTFGSFFLDAEYKLK